MPSSFEIIIRDSKGNEIVKQAVPNTCMISVLEVEKLKDANGWNKRKEVWCNLTEEEKRRMLEHST